MDDIYRKKGCRTDIKAQNLTGEYIIGGFIPAHMLIGNKYETTFYGITWASAMLYAIDEINRDTKLLPGVTLGYDIRDTCNEKSLAAKYSLDFMLDTAYLRPKIEKFKKDNSLCVYRNNSHRIIAGIIGPASSAAATVVSNILSSDYIPQISYYATISDLLDRSKYRSVIQIDDAYQAAAVADLLAHFNWTYVSAFASDDAYGRFALDELRKATNQRGICLGNAKTFDPKFMERELPNIIADILKVNSVTHVVILWCNVRQASAIIKATQKSNIKNLMWIGDVSWGTNKHAIGQLNASVIGLRLEKIVIPRFENAIYESYSSNCKNPWFKIYVKTYLGPYFPCHQHSQFLARILPTIKYAQVIASVYALAHGLHKTLNCSDHACSHTNKTLDYKLLHADTLKSDFTIPSSTYRVKFNSNGEIMGNTSNTYTFFTNITKSSMTQIGYWRGKNLIFINKTLLNWGEHGQPKAHCSSTCMKGSYRIKGSSQCCWTCTACPGNSISTTYNQDNCETCPATEIANTDHTHCWPLREIRLRADRSPGLVILIASVFGLLCAVLVLCIFIKYWNTPVIKSSSREMSCIQLVSLLLLFCFPLIYLYRLTSTICMIRIIAFGFFYTNIVALIVIKTYRLLRVFNGRFQKMSRFLQNKYQIMFSYLLVIAQFAATMFWLWNFPSQTKLVIDRSDNTYVLVCSEQQEVIFWAVLIYIFILALLSGYMAFRARKLPENFNEAKFISFAMFTCCVIWAMYVPFHLSFVGVKRDYVFLSFNICSAFCLLVILYGYKVRIILFDSYLNSPEHFRKKAADEAVKCFIKDVQASKCRGIVEDTSMYAFQTDRRMTKSLPNSGYTVTLDAIDGIEMVQFIRSPSLKYNRASSLNDITSATRELFKSESVSISMEMQKNDVMSLMKKSQSTPMLFDDSQEATRNHNLRNSTYEI